MPLQRTTYMPAKLPPAAASADKTKASGLAEKIDSSLDFAQSMLVLGFLWLISYDLADFFEQVVCGGSVPTREERGAGQIGRFFASR